MHSLITNKPLHIRGRGRHNEILKLAKAAFDPIYIKYEYYHPNSVNSVMQLVTLICFPISKYPEKPLGERRVTLFLPILILTLIHLRLIV